MSMTYEFESCHPHSFLASPIAHSIGYVEVSVINIYLKGIYALIIVPVIGSGMIITIHSWIALYRDRSLSNLGTTGWNTLTTAYNTYYAVNSIRDSFEVIKTLLVDDDSNSEAPSKIIFLVAITLLLGS